MPAPGPNYYSTSPLINVGSTAGEIIQFGFRATWLRVYNPGSVDLYLDPVGNVPSTGTGHIIKAGGDMTGLLPPVSRIGLTTTSTGAGGTRVSVLALAD